MIRNAEENPIVAKKRVKKEAPLSHSEVFPLLQNGSHTPNLYPGPHVSEHGGLRRGVPGRVRDSSGGDGDHNGLHEVGDGEW